MLKFYPINQFRLSAIVASVVFTAAYSMPTLAAERVDAQVAAQTKSQLDTLADAFYESRAQFDPLFIATINGDNRYDDQLSIAIDPKNRVKQFQAMHQMQLKLKAIPRSNLGYKERLNYDLLAYEIDSALHFEHFPEHLLPLNQMDNVPSILANFASGEGSQALVTVKDYYAYFHRLENLPMWIAQAITNMREGIKRGIVQPKSITRAMLQIGRAHV